MTFDLDVWHRPYCFTLRLSRSSSEVRVHRHKRKVLRSVVGATSSEGFLGCFSNDTGQREPAQRSALYISRSLVDSVMPSARCLLFKAETLFDSGVLKTVDAHVSSSNCLLNTCFARSIIAMSVSVCVCPRAYLRNCPIFIKLCLLPIKNESVPIQLAQCWFPGLAISNPKK